MDSLTTWFEGVVQWLVALVEQLGVIGILVMTFLESTFLPIPSEMTMIPAGFLVHEGKMALLPVLLASIVGTIGGAVFNYWLAVTLGRKAFLRFGKYCFLTPAKLEKIERFFAKHGAFSTFTGRLIPGVRHYISFPAGLARMDFRVFLVYTALGGTLWMAVLLTIGYHLGANKEQMAAVLPWLKLGILAVVALLTAMYVWRMRRKARHSASRSTS